MAFTLVNGYICRNCTDIDLAKKGVDPAHPPNKFDPTAEAKKAGAKVAADGVNRPVASGTLGTQVNLLT
jgi:hypothetical protein